METATVCNSLKVDGNKIFYFMDKQFVHIGTIIHREEKSSRFVVRFGKGCNDKPFYDPLHLKNFITERYKTGHHGKISHPTITEAKKHIKSMLKNFGKRANDLEVYRCLFCKQFHIGHKK